MLDTVGAVCVDSSGYIASAVSSGGLLLKHTGRVGQAAVYGCGCWAENNCDGMHELLGCPDFIWRLNYFLFSLSLSVIKTFIHSLHVFLWIIFISFSHLLTHFIYHSFILCTSDHQLKLMFIGQGFLCFLNKVLVTTQSASFSYSPTCSASN